MKKPVIALVGLSGVGKSTFASKVSSMCAIEICSASEIIQNTLEASSGRKWTKEEMRLAYTDTMQDALITGFEEIRSRIDTPILIDAHTLIDKGKYFDVVKPSYFEQLGINMIAHLLEEPKVIAERRVSDNNRTRPQVSAATLEIQQTKSVEQAVRISTALGIECFQLRPSDYDNFVNVLYPELAKWRSTRKK